MPSLLRQAVVSTRLYSPNETPSSCAAFLLCAAVDWSVFNVATAFYNKTRTSTRTDEKLQNLIVSTC